MAARRLPGFPSGTLAGLLFVLVVALAFQTTGRLLLAEETPAQEEADADPAEKKADAPAGEGEAAAEGEAPAAGEEGEGGEEEPKPPSPEEIKALTDKATELLEAGQPAEVIALLEAKQEVFSDAPELRDMYVQALVAVLEPLIEAANPNWPEIEAKAQALVNQDGRHPLGNYALGLALANRKKPDLAKALVHLGAAKAAKKPHKNAATAYWTVWAKKNWQFLVAGLAGLLIGGVKLIQKRKAARQAADLAALAALSEATGSGEARPDAAPPPSTPAPPQEAAQATAEPPPEPTKPATKPAPTKKAETAPAEPTKPKPAGKPAPKAAAETKATARSMAQPAGDKTSDQTAAPADASAKPAGKLAGKPSAQRTAPTAPPATETADDEPVDRPAPKTAPKTASKRAAAPPPILADDEPPADAEAASEPRPAPAARPAAPAPASPTAALEDMDLATAARLRETMETPPRPRLPPDAKVEAVWEKLCRQALSRPMPLDFQPAPEPRPAARPPVTGGTDAGFLVGDDDVTIDLSPEALKVDLLGKLKMLAITDGELRQLLLQRNPDHLPHLCEYIMTRPEPARLAFLARELGHYRDPAVTDVLASLLFHEDLRVVLAAIHGLQTNGGPGAILHLCPFVQSTVPAIAEGARTALATFGARRILEAFLTLPTHPDERLRAGGVYILARMRGEEVTGLLITMLNDQSPAVRQEVMLAMAFQKDPVYLPALREFARKATTEEDRRLARKAIVYLQSFAAPATRTGTGPQAA